MCCLTVANYGQPWPTGVSEAISNNFISAATAWPWALTSLSRCLTHGLRLSQADWLSGEFLVEFQVGAMSWKLGLAETLQGSEH